MSDHEGCASRTHLTEFEVRPLLRGLVGTRSSGRSRLGRDERDSSTSPQPVAVRHVKGAGWCVRPGYGWPEDLAHTKAECGLVFLTVQCGSCTACGGL